MSGFGIASEKVPTMKSLDGVNKKNDVNNIMPKRLLIKKRLRWH